MLSWRWRDIPNRCSPAARNLHAAGQGGGGVGVPDVNNRLLVVGMESRVLVISVDLVLVSRDLL